MINNMDKSLCELMEEAYYLACAIGYETKLESGHYFDVRDLDSISFHFVDIKIKEELSDIVFCWVDGLYHKYYENIKGGRCSLNATINFDLEKFESDVISHIADFKKIIAVLPPLRTLTKEEMRKRGYRGAMAGYTEREDLEYYIEETVKNIEETKRKIKLEKDFDKRYKLEYYDLMEYNKILKEYQDKLAALSVCHEKL